LILLITVGPFAAVTPALLAARTNGPVFTSRHVYWRQPARTVFA
jgi:hypothetical protein